MYIPSYYKEEDKERILLHLQHNPFGIITCASDEKVEATHLPFIVENDSGRMKLISHLSAANPQWKLYKERELLVIFSGPDAYISPKNYEKYESVPTWNYTTVHIRGRAQIITDENESRSVINKTIERFEPEYMAQWRDLNERYKAGMMKGLVAFELIIESVEAKFKLSQNKKSNEVRNIVSDLDKREDSRARELSKVMKEHYGIDGNLNM